MRKIIIMFPGQGSQKTGMGDNLLEKYQELISSADELLQTSRSSLSTISTIDIPSIQELCSNPNHTTLLNRTDFTQPLLYLVNALSYQEYQKTTFPQDPDIETEPIFIGHSLGEYNALQAAGAFDILTGFKLVLKRGELMNEAKGGAMAAVIGLEDESVIAKVNEIRAGLKSEESEETVEVANFNSPGQIIISGSKDAVATAGEILKNAGAKKIIHLAVSGAFHSSMMKPAANAFREYLKEFSFDLPTHTVYSNVSAMPYPTHTVDVSHAIKELLTKQIYSSVQWTKQIQSIKKDFSSSELEFKELGPGQVLTGLVKRIS